MLTENHKVCVLNVYMYFISLTDFLNSCFPKLKQQNK